MDLSVRRQTSIRKSQLRDICNKVHVLQRLRFKLQDIALEHVGAEISRALLTLNLNEFKYARARSDIPHGLFGLSFDKFYERRTKLRNDTYIDLCMKEHEDTLQRAKISIVIEDLHNFVKNLFLNYGTAEESKALMDVSNSHKMLSYDRTLTADYRKNYEHMQETSVKLKIYSDSHNAELESANAEIEQSRLECAESNLILEPIKRRYKLAYTERTMDQLHTHLIKTEEKLESKLISIDNRKHGEDVAMKSISFKQVLDIDRLKLELDTLNIKYNQEYTNWQNQITYKQKSLKFMRDQLTELTEISKTHQSRMEELKEKKLKWEKKMLKLEAKKLKMKKKNEKMEKAKGCRD